MEFGGKADFKTRRKTVVVPTTAKVGRLDDKLMLLEKHNFSIKNMKPIETEVKKQNEMIRQH